MTSPHILDTPERKLFWDPSFPDRIQCILTTEHGQEYHLVFSSRPTSSDYHPNYFNRAAKELRAAGCPAPNRVPCDIRP
jgi:hypothetical protein